MFSQRINVRIENITFPDERQLTNVFSVVQDSTGLIWFSNNGEKYIHVYDGKTLRTLDHAEIPGLPSRSAFNKGPDGTHLVFEDTTLKSFNPYTWQTATFIRAPSRSNIVRVLFGKNGRVWGQSYGPDLVILSSENGSPFAPIDTILPEWYYDEVRTTDDRYYVKVKNKVYEYDINGRTNVFHLPKGIDPIMPSFEIDAAGTLWVSYSPDKLKNEYAVFYKRKDMEGFERFPASDQLTQNGRFGQFRFDGRDLWFSGSPFRLFRLNSATGGFEDFTESILQQKGNFPFYKNLVQKMFRDRSGQVWIINRGGVSKMLVEDAIQTYRITRSIDENCPPGDCNIGGIAEDDRGNIYFTSSVGSLWKLDPTGEKMNLVSRDAGVATMIQHSMAFDHGQLLLNDRVVDVQSGTHRRISGETTFTDHWVVAVDRENHRRWAAAHGVQGKLFQYGAPNPDKLFSYHPATREWEVIPLTDTIASGQNVEFRKLLYSRRRNALLLGRMSKGLVEMTTDGRVLRQDRRVVHTTDLYEDDDGQLWVSAESERGLMKYDPNLDSLDRQPYHPLPSVGPLKNVYHILPENEDHIWLVSILGIFKLHRQTGKLTRFPMFPSFSKTGFLRLPAFAAADGTFYIGTITGEVIAFHPRQVQEQSKLNEVFRVALTQYSRYNERKDSLFVQQNHLTGLENIRLTHQDRSFSLEFFVPDFRNPRQNKFTWRLEGYDNDWTPPTVNNRLQYENLPPGQYTLRIRGGLMEEYYPSSERTLRVTVLQAWYKSGWAFLIYTFLLGITAFAFYRFQLNRQLEKAEAKRLKEMDALKTRLYTNITHEFRTPLTVIMGMTENIQGHEKERSLIRRNGKNLLRLINQMLDLSRLDSGTMKMNWAQSDIIDYLQYLTESFYSMAGEKKVRLTFYTEVPELVMDFDEGKIQHVVYNLLSNAIKFTGEGGKVVLHAGRTERRGQSYLKLNVQDTGAGIPEEQIEHIFDRFYQADSSPTRKVEGAGIGLALTKELVELMGGSIAVKSELGKGATFTLLLPVRRDSPPHEFRSSRDLAPELAPEVTAADPALSNVAAGELIGEKPVVLLIEDNTDVVAYIAGLLEKEYEIHMAANGQAGIEKALELVPDIVISDVMMPEKDGYEVCEMLKNDERTSHVPIILLTAKAAETDRIAGLRRGADAYLMKPFNQEELFVRVEKLLELRRRLQERYTAANSDSSSINTAAGKTPEPTLEDRFLHKIRQAIEEKMDDPELGIQDLCRAVNLSHTQLFRKLKALTGENPTLFIRKMRLQKAAILLKTTKMNISEIAYEVGFSDPNYFSRAFHEEFGASPSAARD